MSMMEEEKAIDRLKEEKAEHQREIQSRQELIANCKRYLQNPSNSDEDRANLKRQVRSEEEEIQHLKSAVSTIDTRLEVLESDLSAKKQEQYDNAMKEGTIPLESANSVVVGVAGSGKTHSLAMAVDHTVPTKRVSTTCTKAPIRTVTRVKVGVKDDKMMRMEHRRYFDTVRNTIKAKAHSTRPIHQSRIRIFFDMVMKTIKGKSHSSPSVTRDAPQFVRDMEEQITRYVVDGNRYEDEFHDLGCEDLLFHFRWNKLTDSGGQPQFLEILPIFMHHISLGIFTVKLNERLDHFPMIEYYNELGKLVGRPYKSCYSHEQILRYCMRALVSQGKRGSTKLLFLGTHKDLKDDCKGESIAQKNARLRAMVSSFGMEENVVYCNQNFDLIFAIDAKNPKEEDWKVMEQVREVMVESSKVPPVDIPIKWFTMELALLQFVEEKKQAVLLESTCWEMVSCFHFDRASFKAALRYLHQVKLIFYYESMHLIVADIQVFLDILSQVVCYNIELRSSPSQHATLEFKWKRFSRHGILHANCLDEFPDHYIEGVFSPKELLQMFINLGIVSELGSDEYLMPCLLPPGEGDLCYPECSVPAMVVDFFAGGPMLGVYCGLICYLLTVAQWELAKQHNGDPSHLTRSSIHLSAPGKYPGRVCISDPISSFFLVEFRGDGEVASRVCPLIRRDILTGVEQVSKGLNYSPIDGAAAGVRHVSGKPETTFLCPCKTLPLHPAAMSEDGDFLSCPIGSEASEKVTPAHRTWFGGASSLPSAPVGLSPSSTAVPCSQACSTSPVVDTVCPTSSSSAPEGDTVEALTADDTPLGIDDLGEVLETVETLSARWRLLSVKLGIREGSLDTIQQNHPGDVQSCLYKALSEWLKLNYAHQRHGRPSWRRLAEAVRRLDCALFETVVREHRSL